ncbi:uncharacterized protein [Macrobrachium rosenbergii]|uniref:uncharacterized protein isoform X1 n=1 Tax=Macrobrachium rosenbergii TaxID=79674 RepID=UPI0034D3BE21
MQKMTMAKQPSDGAVPLIKELREDVLRIKQKRDVNYDWITETFDINFCDFRKKNYEEICGFELYMDLSQWDLLANGLGLNADEIMWCRQYHKAGPTQEVFNLLAKKRKLEELTLGDILSLLKKLKLTSLLTRVKWQDCIGQYRASASKVNQSSGHSISNGVAWSHGPDSFTLSILQVPEILVTSENGGFASASEINSVCHEPLKSKAKKKFGARIIMIFASDAREEALKAAHQLKTPQGSRREIGVLILTSTPSSEVSNALLHDPWNSIHKWFKEVDFVVPVLSKQLLCQIQVRDSDPSTLQEMQYNRFVYRLLLDDYVSNMSKNYKCRALCSHDSMSEVRKSEVVKANGLLEMNWDCSSEEEVQTLAEILISGAKERRRHRRENAVH